MTGRLCHAALWESGDGMSLASGSGGAPFGVGAAVSCGFSAFFAGFWKVRLPMPAPYVLGFALALAASPEPERKIQ